MPPSTGRTGVANGNIRPYRAVKLDTTTNMRMIEAGANASCMGISGHGTRLPPWTALNDSFLAIAGENFRYHGLGEEHVSAELGGTVTTERRLKSHSDGTLIAITSDADFVVAIARIPGVAGDIIPVDIRLGQAAA